MRPPFWIQFDRKFRRAGREAGALEYEMSKSAKNRDLFQSLPNEVGENEPWPVCSKSCEHLSLKNLRQPPRASVSPLHVTK